ncbi:uncharacterized protein LOC123315066 [Coccinella septempunctata]|uniref:uncharacterized protein LOC123315066 n=1 Tax=Coccinella septempunctata TaxID=41139 RepID=UPI001D074444|nr:uncharacterized protein LOC123315066 [Coccinella septempunctata]
MKSYFVVFLVFSIIINALALKIDFNHKEPRHKDCIGHLFGAGQIALLNRGDHVDPFCPEYSRHLKCIWKQMGVMNEEGILQEGVIVEKIDELSNGDQNDIKKAKGCIVQKKTQEKTANDFYNCIHLLVKKYNT